MGFKETGRKWKGVLNDLAERPYALGKQRIGQGMSQISFISSLLENNDVKPGSEEDFVAKWSAASVYAGGADTVGTMLYLFSSMWKPANYG